MKPLLAALAVVLAVACSDPFTPTVQRVAGAYHAVSFTATDSAGTTDWMPSTRLDIRLFSNGRTDGLLWMIGGGEGGTDIQQLMTGSWSLDGDTVRFSQTADTFVRDIAFLARATRSDDIQLYDRLEGDQTFAGMRIRILLKRQTAP